MLEKANVRSRLLLLLTTLHGAQQDNTSPYVASFGLLSGSCGYGELYENQARLMLIVLRSRAGRLIWSLKKGSNCISMY